ncbi:MAG: ribonuclease Z [Gemmatimonadaceae bacterium]
MRLTTIGTGTAAPSPTRVCSAHLAEAGSVRLLMDCGSGAVHRMSSLGLSWMGITHVALTHFHADHISDVAVLIFAWRYGELPARSAPVELIGPVGTAALFDKLAAAFGEWMKAPGFPLVVREMEAGASIDLGDGVTLSSRAVPHTEESVAYSVLRGAARCVYTGDTGFDESFGEWAAGCGVLLSECSLPEAMAIPTHLTPAQCGALAGRAQPGRLALTHFYPPVERVDIRAIVAQSFAGDVALAVDGWSTELEEA